MQFVMPALNDEDAYKRKAALLALAVLAEGCADYIRNRFAAHLSLHKLCIFTQCIFKNRKKYDTTM